MQIIGTRAPSHLEQVVRQYALTYGHDLSHAIKKEIGGDLRKALTNAVRSLQNRPLYLAELFDKSMAGIGTNEEMLIRLLVRTRYPKVMSAVKEAFLSKYGKTLANRVGGEIGGNFKKLAIAIIESA
ncbi:hypothetical protein HDU93_001097 [Gonapodya sp. JEL0774]|nr:hypothetical protein HDU93_001097 [Gonapodya sp. JEL0774]